MAVILFKFSQRVQPRGSNVHTSFRCYANPGKFLNKIMGNTKPKKKIFSDSPILPSASAFSKGANEGKFSKNSRRSSVLNKMFMRYITDLMATGEYSSEFLGHGIEINFVQIAPDYKILNVFWNTKLNQNDEEIENILKKNAGYLRHELSGLKVMGAVPKIQFVKDKRSAELAELDARLAKADFGEDHVPLELGSKLKNQLELIRPLDPEIREKIQNLDEEQTAEEEELEEPLPAMPQDVLGLNHAEILTRIKKVLRRSEAKHREIKDERTIPLQEDPLEVEKLQEQRIAFKEFLQKRELIRSRLKKIDKNYCPDLEYLREEFKERDVEYFKNMEVYDTYDDKDFIEDDDEVENK